MNSDFKVDQSKLPGKKSLSEEITIAAGQSTKERAYWLKQFQGEPVKSFFPYDYPSKKGKGYEFHHVEIEFTGELFQRLMVLRNDSDYTLHMVLTAALAALLNKCTGSSDIIVGTPVDKQEEDSDSEFINSVLPLRNHIIDDMTFKQLLLQVRQTILEAVENQNYPFEMLLYDLNLSTPGEDNGLFDAALLLENIHEKSYLQHIPKNILFCFRRIPETIALTVEYNALLYRESTVERLIAFLEKLMREALFNVDIPLLDIDILTAQERHQLLAEFNDTVEDYPVDQTLHGLFEEQVEKTPDNIALLGYTEGTRGLAPLSDPISITYNQLNQKSNLLAYLLIEKGVQPDNIAAVMVEQSVEMIIAVLAILKAGGAYMPIDPDYPEERIQYMLTDSASKILVTTPDLSRKIEFANDIIYLTDAMNRVPTSSHLHLSPAPATYLAYTIYTSGSTGQPKGVLVQHQQVVNTLLFRKEEYNMTPNHAALQLFSYVFDGFITSFFTPIISGAVALVLESQQTADVTAIKDAIIKNKITHFISVPALYRVILEGLDNQAFTTLQVITLAGDTFSPQLPEITRQKNKNIELAHEYGVTEAAVMSTLHRHQERDSRITIGRPITNTRIYILDRHHCLQPIGIPGELSIAGAGAARGYLNNPELTSQKFQISNPKSQTNNVPFGQINNQKFLQGGPGGTVFTKRVPPGRRRQKIYKTGDLARWFPDGNIEFLGRIDHQVKIRGIRVEPGEIEHQLVSHKQIKEAVVITREHSSGNRYLCAYWVPNPAAALEIPGQEDLREYLTSRLAPALIPSYFVQMEEIPLTANGKIDRSALPQPEITAAETYIAPRDKVEKQLTAIWSEVLDIQQSLIGIDDNFFKLGGHSLLVTQLVLKIEQGFGVKISFTEVFRAPSIRRLREYIKNAGKQDFQLIQQGEEKEYYPVSAAQKRMFLENRLKEDDTSYNTPQLVLIEGNPDKNRIREVVSALIQRHESLRTSFQVLHDTPIQRVHREVDFQIHHMEAKENQLEDIIKRFIRPFDLAKAPLLRINLVKLQHNHTNENRHLLMYDLHHIIGDGVSMEIAARDLMDLYEGLEPIGLNIQYKDFTIWQNHLLQSDSLKEQEAYWLKVFAGEIPVLELPTDYPRTAVQHFEGDTLYFDLSPRLTQKIKKMAVDMGGTLFTVLLTIFNILLSRYSGQEDIIVGTLTAGRQHIQLEHLIGMFVNTLAIRNFPTKEKTFNQLLEEVTTNSLKAFENQDFQFEELVNRLGVKRDMSRHILFNVMFAEFVSDKKKQARPIKNLVFKPYNIKHENTPFDLVLYASDNGDTATFKWIYCTHLFKKETIEQMKQHFIKIAESVAANPREKISSISLLSSKDKKRFSQHSSKEKLKNIEIQFDF